MWQSGATSSCFSLPLAAELNSLALNGPIENVLDEVPPMCASGIRGVGAGHQEICCAAECGKCGGELQFESGLQTKYLFGSVLFAVREIYPVRR